MYCRFSKKRGQVWLNKVTPVPTFSGEAVTSNAPSHQLDHAEWLGCKKTLQGHRKRQDSDRICQALISGTTFCVKRPVQIWNLAKQAEASCPKNAILALSQTQLLARPSRDGFLAVMAVSGLAQFHKLMTQKQEWRTHHPGEKRSTLARRFSQSRQKVP